MVATHGCKTSTAKRFTLLVTAAAVRSVFIGALAAGAAPVAMAQSATAADVRDYAIAAGPLGDVLAQFAAKSGVQLVFDPRAVAGRQSAGITGRYGVDAGFDRLLQGTGFQAVRREAAEYTLQTRDASLPVSNVVDARIADASRVNPPTTVASRIPLTQREIANTVDVMTQDQIREQNFQSLDQAMKYVPGVHVFQSDADRVQYYARGFPISAMQIDGVPVAMNDNMSGTGSTNAPSLAIYERVEVLDGPAGLFGGFGNPGGVINLVRKHAPSEYQFSADVGVGTKANWLGTIDVGGPINAAGTLRGRFVASGQTQHLVQDGTWRNDQVYYGTLEADLTSATMLRLGASYMQRNSNVGWANATPVYDDGTPVAGRSTNFGAPWNHDQYTYTNVFATLEHKLDNGWKLAANVDYAHNSARVYSGEFFSTVDRSTGLARFGTTNTDTTEDNVSLDLSAHGGYSLFGLPSQAAFGVSYSRISNKLTSYYGSTDSYTNMFHWADVNALSYSYPEQSFETTQKGTTVYSQYGIYGNTRIKLLDSLALILGARVSWWHYDFAPNATYNPLAQTASKEQYTGKVTPYAGLVYDINPTYSAYVSYAQIFQPQYLLQQSGQAIAPIQGKQYEVGVKGSYLDGRVNASVALFQINQENRAQLDPSDPTFTYYVSTGSARSRGVDLRLSGELLPNWTVSAGYTYVATQLFQNDSYDTTASPFAQIAPKHSFKLWTNYRLPGNLSQWEVGAGVTATSELYYDMGGGVKVQQGGYYIVDARVAYQVTPKVSVNLNVTNLFNRTYFQPMSNSVIYGAGRGAMVTLRYQM